MPKAKLELGITMVVGPSDLHQYWKCTLGIDEIDTEGDVKSQIASSKKVLRQAFDMVSEKLDEVIDENVDAKIVRKKVK